MRVLWGLWMLKVMFSDPQDSRLGVVMIGETFYGFREIGVCVGRNTYVHDSIRSFDRLCMAKLVNDHVPPTLSGWTRI